LRQPARTPPAGGKPTAGISAQSSPARNLPVCCACRVRQTFWQCRLPNCWAIAGADHLASAGGTEAQRGKVRPALFYFLARQFAAL